MNTIELIDKAIETHETLATINEKEKQLDKSMKEYKEMTKKCSHIGVDLGLYKGHLIKRCLLCCQTLFDKKNEPPHPIIKAFKYNDTPTETKEEINERYKEIFFALVSLGKTNDLSKELIDNSINTHKLFKDIEEAERFLQTNRPIYKKTAHDCQHIGLHLGNNSEKDWRRTPSGVFSDGTRTCQPAKRCPFERHQEANSAVLSITGPSRL